MIDVQVHSIEAPPVIIKGEEAELNVSIMSYGKLKERANVTLYDNKKLIGLCALDQVRLVAALMPCSIHLCLFSFLL